MKRVGHCRSHTENPFRDKSNSPIISVLDFPIHSIPKLVDFGTRGMVALRIGEGSDMNSIRTRRAAIYARVSTGSQTTENQVRELRQVAERHGWTVVAEFLDTGISGAKQREQRPGLGKLLQAVARREIDMVMAWSVDRLGRSLQHLVEFLGELHGKRVDLYLHQQGIDTSTPAGKAL